LQVLIVPNIPYPELLKTTNKNKKFPYPEMNEMGANSKSTKDFICKFHALYCLLRGCCDTILIARVAFDLFFFELFNGGAT